MSIVKRGRFHDEFLSCFLKTWYRKSYGWTSLVSPWISIRSFGLIRQTPLWFRTLRAHVNPSFRLSYFFWILLFLDHSSLWRRNPILSSCSSSFRLSAFRRSVIFLLSYKSRHDVNFFDENDRDYRRHWQSHFYFRFIDFLLENVSTSYDTTSLPPVFLIVLSYRRVFLLVLDSLSWRWIAWSG